MSILLAVSATGCDLITSIKEYFQEPEKKTDIVKPIAPAKALAPQTQPAAPKSQPNIKIAPIKLSSPMAPNVLARVGTWNITIDEFTERLQALKEVVPEYDITDPQAKLLVLDELINQQILVMGAEQAGGLERKKDIDAAVEEFRRTLIVREVARQLTEDVTMTDQEAMAFYEENKEAMITPMQWHVREIVFADKEQATHILTEILKGADFAEMAKQYSIGRTASDGGDLGFITQEPFPQMGSALLAAEVGDTSSVFKGPEGYYIVKLEEKKGGEPIAFEDIKGDIIQTQTLVKQQQVIISHLEKLKSNIKVERNENLLQ